MLHLDFSFWDVRFGVAWIYDPNGKPERNLFLTLVNDNLDPGTPTVLAGHFNTVFGPLWFSSW